VDLIDKLDIYSPDEQSTASSYKTSGAT